MVSVGRGPYRFLVFQPRADGAADSGQGTDDPGEGQVVGGVDRSLQRLFQHGRVDQQRRGERRSPEEHDIGHRGGQGEGEGGAPVEQPGQLGRRVPVRLLPQAVRDDQPGHQRGQPEQHDHGEAERAEGVAHLPDGVGGEGERGCAERADQQFGQAQQSTPGAVRADHSGQQPRPAGPPRGDVAQLSGVAPAVHPVDGGDPARQLGRFPSGRPYPLVGGVGEQPVHEVRDDRADGRHLAQSERGQRHQGGPAPGGGLRDQRHPVGVQRQVGQAERDVPPVVGAPSSEVVEQRVGAAVTARGHVTPAFPDGPSHVGVHPLGQPVGQLGAQPRGDPGRVIRWGRHQSDDDLRAAGSTVGHHRS
jgi:hypothetical protein